MASEIALDYPHDARTLQPRQLHASEIAKLAMEVRNQLVSARTVKIDLSTIMRASGQMIVNGHQFEAHWEVKEAIVSEEGGPAFGMVDFDPELPRAAMVLLDANEVRSRDYLARSTAAHELGHLIFDVPWRLRHIEKTGQVPSSRSGALTLLKSKSSSRGPRDWEEWRANEFMGALLAPERLVHSQALQVCAEIKVPRRQNAYGRLIIDGRKADWDVVHLVMDEVAERFGLSSDFMQVRFDRYGLVQPTPSYLHA